MNYFVFAFLCLVLAFQAWVSFRVMRTDVYERQQKSAQLTFIWMLPVLGAVIAFYVLREADPDPRQAQRQTEQRRG